MSIDVGQFAATFLEESLEGLDSMESLLLSLVDGDTEAVNAIFRAAHSIKGGAATFGFVEVGRFTHGVETLLDQMRSGKRTFCQEQVTLLLDSVDCIRNMLLASRDGSELDTRKITEIHSAIENCLKEGDVSAADRTEDQSPATVPVMSTFSIRFAPHEGMLITGNDPLRILASLAELGQFKAHCNTENLGDLLTVDVQNCYLSWQIDLQTTSPREEIVELFEWVDDLCDISIEEVSEEDPAVRNEEQSRPPVGADIRQSTTAPAQTRESGSIRVNTDKVDALINMVGELVITQSMLGQLGELIQSGDSTCIDKLQDGLSQLERNTRELQETVMGIRMLPISFVFNRFPRMIHDLSKSLSKPLKLHISGEQTELDKNVLEKISDPMIHLVRNAADHGIEPPSVRRDAGKPETGVIKLNAYHRGGNIVIEISDDGAGLNAEKIRQKAIDNKLIPADSALSEEQIHELIFSAGFSTADVVSDVSGRGVGMDVVKKNIKSLGGNVEVSSISGKGSTFTIRLPLTLSILDGQLIEINSEIYVIPLTSIVESTQVSQEEFDSVIGSHLMYRLRDEYIPVLFLNDLLGTAKNRTENEQKALLVVVESEGIKAGIAVDDLLGQQQVVIKALETNYQKLEGVSGATILGDGTVSLILDVASLLGMARLSRPGRSR